MKNAKSKADLYKENGNKNFLLGNFSNALDDYTKSLIFNPKSSLTFSNLALTFFNLNDFQNSIKACDKALQIDEKNIKAHFCKGRCFLNLALYEKSLKSLKNALELSRESGITCDNEIIEIILLATIKHKKYPSTNLKSHMLSLILENKERKLSETSHDGSKNLNETHKVKLINQIYDECVKCISDTFEYHKNNVKVDKVKTKEVPDYLCGKISFEIMKNPVIVPSGITYDKVDIENHLKRVGHFDPITRQPLSMKQLIPNLALKEVIEQYLQENPSCLDE